MKGLTVAFTPSSVRHRSHAYMISSRKKCEIDIKVADITVQIIYLVSKDVF